MFENKKLEEIPHTIILFGNLEKLELTIDDIAVQHQLAKIITETTSKGLKDTFDFVTKNVYSDLNYLLVIPSADKIRSDVVGILLKSIEEAPDNFWFVLTASQDYMSIPETVQSRAILYPLEEDKKQLDKQVTDFVKFVDENLYYADEANALKILEKFKSGEIDCISFCLSYIDLIMKKANKNKDVISSTGYYKWQSLALIDLTKSLDRLYVDSLNKIMIMTELILNLRKNYAAYCNE